MINIISEYNLNGNVEEFLAKLENFSFYLGDLGFKKDREEDDFTLKFRIDELAKIPEIKDKEILNNERFIKNFYRIFWDLISKLGIATQNFYIFIDKIVYQLNRITLPNYVITDCHSTDNYNCGRAMTILEGKSKFLIFNTDDKGYMDTYTQTLYLGCDKLKKDKKSPIKLENLEKYYGRISKRIEKEINILKKDFNVEAYENIDGIKLVLINKTLPKILITLNLPLNYPFSGPSGTFKDLTISEIDIDWNERKSLKDIVYKLMYKYEKGLFPKHKEILCYLYILDF